MVFFSSVFKGFPDLLEFLWFWEWLLMLLTRLQNKGWGSWAGIDRSLLGMSYSSSWTWLWMNFCTWASVLVVPQVSIFGWCWLACWLRLHLINCLEKFTARGKVFCLCLFSLEAFVNSLAKHYDLLPFHGYFPACLQQWISTWDI